MDKKARVHLSYDELSWAQAALHELANGYVFLSEADIEALQPAFRDKARQNNLVNYQQRKEILDLALKFELAEIRVLEAEKAAS